MWYKFGISRMKLAQALVRKERLYLDIDLSDLWSESQEGCNHSYQQTSAMHHTLQNQQNKCHVLVSSSHLELFQYPISRLEWRSQYHPQHVPPVQIYTQGPHCNVMRQPQSMATMADTVQWEQWAGPGNNDKVRGWAMESIPQTCMFSFFLNSVLLLTMRWPQSTVAMDSDTVQCRTQEWQWSQGMGAMVHPQKLYVFF